MKMKRLLIGVCVFAAAMTAYSQKPTATPDASSGPKYEDLLTKLKGGDTKIDYRALRIAYSNTKDASPYGADRQAESAMNKALNEKRYKDAIKSADTVLKDTFVNSNAHAVESIAYRELGDADKADFHKAVYLGLINSIIASGDGKTQDTAFVVISTEEEYSVMYALGYSAGGQSLQHGKEHMFDVLHGSDSKTGATVDVYFNIDIVWAMESKMFSR
jgi:hypothetical protein